MAADRDDVHSALTQLFSPGGALETPPSELTAYFDDLAIARTAKAYMRLQDEVSTGGHAVVVTAGPPGAGKSEARETMALGGYRVIDPIWPKICCSGMRMPMVCWRTGTPTSCPTESPSACGSLPRTSIQLLRGPRMSYGSWRWAQAKTSSWTELYLGGHSSMSTSMSCSAPDTRTCK